ncbi:MAG TPA: CoA-binding protein, partial [Denitromonas sp.]|nr:CoA-binding protein [Denitromonas sp.]
MKEKHYLTPLFEPKSVGVIGASERETAIGGVLIRNMLDAGFKGKIFAINPKHDKVHGVKCYKSVEDVPLRLDMVVIATAAQKVPAIIDSCGRAGVKAAIVLSAGFSETGPRGAALERSLMDTARRHKIRLLGPNCLGIMRPDLGLNATFA